MTRRINTALAVATLFTLGAVNQASAFDLLDELFGGGVYAESCGCAQKDGGHVQRCGSDCGSKGFGGHAQRSSKGGQGKVIGGHAQRSGFGHVQHPTGSKGGSCGGHAQRGCGGSKGGSKGGQVQRGGFGGSKGGSCGGHVQHGKGAVKGGSKGGSSKSPRVDLLSMMRCKMSSMKCKFSSKGGDCTCGHHKGDIKDYDGKSDGYGDGGVVVPAPVIREEVQSVPLPRDPDPST